MSREQQKKRLFSLLYGKSFKESLLTEFPELDNKTEIVTTGRVIKELPSDTSERSPTDNIDPHQDT